MLRARDKERAVNLYAMDLVWMLVKSKYETEIKMPTEKYIEYGKKKPKEKTAQEIYEDVLKGLGGE